MKRSQLLKTRTVPLDMLRSFADAGRLYALLDACDTPSVPPKMWDLGEGRAASLYAGTADENYWSFAPYLAKCDCALIDWISETLWQEPWGLFVVADQSLDALRKHFRHFLQVDGPDDEQMYFRFYDPRILRKYLPTCYVGELDVLFGEIKSFILGEEAGTEANTEICRVPGAWSPAPVRFGIGQRLRIRREQLEVFMPYAERGFEKRLLKHLREYHSGLTEVFPDDILVRMVRPGIAKARSYGITWESNITTFVALMFKMAPNFDRHPFIRTILKSEEIDPEKKLDQVVEQTPERIWREIESSYDANAWL